MAVRVAETSNLLRSLPAARPEWLTKSIYPKVFQLTLVTSFIISLESSLLVLKLLPDGNHIFNFLSITIVPDQKIRTFAIKSNIGIHGLA
jgi:hypothetical protein